MGIDPRGLAQAMGDAEARLNAVRSCAEAMSAKAAALDAVVTHQRERVGRLESALREIAQFCGHKAPIDSSAWSVFMMVPEDLRSSSVENNGDAK
jgi:hypothetical protein